VKEEERIGEEKIRKFRRVRKWSSLKNFEFSSWGDQTELLEVKISLL